jgi:adenylate kinase
MFSRREWIQMLAAAPLAAQSKPGALIVLIGAPGSGKTTISSMIVKEYGYTAIQASEVAERNKATLEKHRRPGITSMDLTEDPAMNALIKAELVKADLGKGVVLDGYPATKFQADFLTQLRKEGLIPLVTVIQLDTPDEVIRQRLAKSAKPEEIEQRIKDFRRELENASLYYPEARLVRIDSNRPAKATFADVKKALDVSK